MAYPISSAGTISTTPITTTPQLSVAEIRTKLQGLKAEEIDRISLKMIGFMVADPKFVTVQLTSQDLIYFAQAIGERSISKEWLAQAELIMKRAKMSHQLLPTIAKMLRESLATDFIDKGVSLALTCDQNEEKRNRYEVPTTHDYKISLTLDRDLTQTSSELVFSFAEQYSGKDETKSSFPLSELQNSF